MNSAEAPTEILAALLWDVPALQAGSSSARDFSKALRGEGLGREESQEHAADALGRAARAVAFERSGDTQAAAELYAALEGDSDPWTQLFGVMLRAWSASEDGLEAITSAHSAVTGLVTNPELVARLLAKLATNAFDEGAMDVGTDFLAEAIELVPSETRLGRALAIEGLNVGLPYEWKEFQTPPPADPLVDYPWIEYASLSAARGSFAAAVDARSRRLWTFHWRAGRTPLDEAVSAEIQATWAGALWLRRPLRKQLGAQLLTGAAQAPEQWGYGVVMWTLGAGQHPARAFGLAEPHLTQSATDFIVRTVGESEAMARYAHRFLSVALEAWDAMSDNTFRWVVRRIEPQEGDHPIAQDTQRLWAAYAARMTESWRDDVMGKDQAVQASIVEHLTVDTVRRLPPAVRQMVFEATAQAAVDRARLDSPIVRVLAAATSGPLGASLESMLADKASASAIAHVAFDGAGDLLPSTAVTRARELLMSSVTKSADEARKGKVSFGPEDPRLSLGRLVAGASSNDQAAVQLLAQVATDATSPSEHILYARNALTLIRRSGKLGADAVPLLRDSEDPAGTFATHGDVSLELLQMARLQVYLSELTTDEVGAVAAGCRSQDARARQVAIAICAEALEVPAGDRADDALIWGLVSGLFDPHDEVVAASVSGVPQDILERHPAAGQVAVARLPRLIEEGNADVRTSVAMLARRWSQSEIDGLADHPVVRAILGQAVQDRSWAVRTAAQD